jgi:hypothetical protein
MVRVNAIHVRFVDSALRPDQLVSVKALELKLP